MNDTRVKIAAVSGLVVSIALGVLALATPVAVAACEPVVCPAIAKLCPDGQIACRVSPCNCALVCRPQADGCGF